MKILDYAFKDASLLASWQPNLRVSGRDELFKKILDALCTPEFFQVNNMLTREQIFQALVDREAVRSTAMGNEIAFPHARLDHLEHPIFAVATLEEPVLFGDQQTRLVCLVLVPASDPSVSLKIMAKFSRVLLEDGGRERVLSARTPEALRSLFEQEKESVDSPIFARDIMRMPRWSVPENTTISECAKMMSTHGLRSIPVLNSKNQVVGEISADTLFQYGLPDFFSRLKSVSFVAEFDPFKKYFEDEREVSVVEVMSTNPQIIPAEYTIMEIVFDLAIRKFNKLYVVDENQSWIGTLTKGIILDDVINL